MVRILRLRILGVRRIGVLVTALALGFVGVLAAPAGPACACSCEAATPEAHEKRASLVFQGDAVAISGSRDAADVRVKFRVTSVAKGRAEEIVYVTTRREGASCGAEFKAGHRYKVYASGNSDGYTSTLCSGNEDLGAGGSPVESPGLNGVTLAAAAGGLLLLGFGAVWFVKRRRPEPEIPQ